MPDLYSILKASRLNPVAAPDGMTAIWAKHLMSKGGGYSQLTLTGVPPFEFYSNGDPIISLSMLGNTQQTGTPTPDNIIMPTFCGVRTANLFDYNTMAHGVDGSYLDESGNLQSSNAWVVTDFIPCNGNAFTLHKVGGGAPSICLYDSEKRYIIGKKYNTGSAATKSDITITSQTTAAYIRFSWYRQNNEAQDDLTKIMLNSGSTALPYEPYGWAEKITCAGQTVPVYLGQVQTVRRVNKYEFTGREIWSKNDATGVFYTFAISNFLMSNGITCMCSHYSAQNNASGVSEVQNKRVCFRTSTYNQFYLNDTDLDSTDALKTYLAEQYANGTPVTVWYVLATPKTGIVNEPLAKIGDYADELNIEAASVAIPTSKGVNTLTVDTVLQPSSATITYYGRPRNSI